MESLKLKSKMESLPLKSMERKRNKYRKKQDYKGCLFALGFIIFGTTTTILYNL